MKYFLFSLRSKEKYWCPGVCPSVCSVTTRSWDKLQILNFLFVFRAELSDKDLINSKQKEAAGKLPNKSVLPDIQESRGLMTGNKGLVDYNTAIHHDWLVNTMAGFCWILTIQSSLTTDMHTSPHLTSTKPGCIEFISHPIKYQTFTRSAPARANTVLKYFWSPRSKYNSVYGEDYHNIWEGVGYLDVLWEEAETKKFVWFCLTAWHSP